MSCSPHAEQHPPLTPPGTPPGSLNGLLAPIGTGTPFSKKASGTEPFTSMHYNRDLRMARMAEEMTGKFVGPMPISQFLNAFIPVPRKKGVGLKFTKQREKQFRKVSTAKTESAMYQPLSDAMQPCCLGLQIVDTHDTPDPDSGVFTSEMLKPDLACYRSDVGRSQITDFSLMEFHVEVKYDKGDDPFQDESKAFERDTVGGRDTMAQITTYAVAQLATQFRTFIFSILIVRNFARLLRWDRSGAIVTEAFDYCEGHLAEFLWRYNCTSREDRGEDLSISVPSQKERKLALASLKLAADKKLIKFAVYSDDENDAIQYFIGSELAFKGHASPTGRATRTFVVYDVQRRRLAYLKDTWRVYSDDMMKEGDTYRALHAANVTHIPQLIASGDIPAQKTHTQDFVPDTWKKKPFRAHRHYRLVLGTIGRDLTQFRSSWEMVNAMRDALQAHKEAYENAQILHRDISVGNILITEDSRGLLIDWDLSKHSSHDQVARQSERTGTWQFMSAELLMSRDPIPHTLTDDLESFLHVLSWVSLRFMRHNLNAEDLRDLMVLMFDHSYQQLDRSHRGGTTKKNYMIGGDVPAVGFENAIVRKLLHDLTTTCAVRYEIRPSQQQYAFYAEVRRTMPNRLDVEEMPPARYEARTQALQNSDWMLGRFTNAVSDRSLWPANDNSHMNELSPSNQPALKKKSQFKTSCAG